MVNAYIYSSFEFMKGNAPAIAEHLSPDVLADGRGSVQLKKHVCFEKVLRTLNLSACH